MINPSVMQLRIELASAKAEKQELGIKMKRCFFELQTLANPYYKRTEEIKADEIEQCGDEMILLKGQLLQVEEKIRDITSQLGE